MKLPLSSYETFTLFAILAFIAAFILVAIGAK